MKFKNILFLVFALSIFASCDPNDTLDDPKIEILPVGKVLPGEWYVNYTNKATGAISKSNSDLTTSNTAENTADEMWIDDHKDFWGLKAKVNCDPLTNTFSIEQGDELYYEIKIDIKNGRVVPNVATTAAGAVTDSIYFDVTFYDVNSAGAIVESNFSVDGIRRTGFLEDEH